MATGTTLQPLPRENLVKTGPVDHADWVYRPVMWWPQADMIPEGNDS